MPIADIIKKFSDGSSNYWVNGKHFCINKENKIEFCAGGGDPTDEDYAVIKEYCLKNKQSYRKRIIVAQIGSFDEIITFGKHINKRVGDVLIEEKSYLLWLRDKYTFKIGEEKLKQQIIDCLK